MPSFQHHCYHYQGDQEFLPSLPGTNAITAASSIITITAKLPTPLLPIPTSFPLLSNYQHHNDRPPPLPNYQHRLPPSLPCYQYNQQQQFHHYQTTNTITTTRWLPIQPPPLPATFPPLLNLPIPFSTTTTELPTPLPQPLPCYQYNHHRSQATLPPTPLHHLRSKHQFHQHQTPNTISSTNTPPPPPPPSPPKHAAKPARTKHYIPPSRFLKGESESAASYANEGRQSWHGWESSTFAPTSSTFAPTNLLHSTPFNCSNTPQLPFP
nr:formin-like protein 20 [Penaeus vannamei]